MITRFPSLTQSIKSVSIILKDLSIIIFTLPINLIIVTQRNNKMQNRWYEMSAQKTQSDLIGYRIFSTADMHLNTNGPSGKLYSWNPRPEGSYFSQKLLTRSWYLWTTRVNLFYKTWLEIPLVLEIGNIRIYSHLIDQTKHCLILRKGGGWNIWINSFSI